MTAATTEEARRWRDWLLRAVAGSPRRLQIMYGLGGERRLTEFEVPWLPGYEGSTPVRIGNAAARSSSSTSTARSWTRCIRRAGGGLERDRCRLAICSSALLDYLAEHLARARRRHLGGARAARRHFTHSKVMAWVAFDRADQGGRAASASKARSTTGGRCAARSTPTSAATRLRSRSRSTFAQYYGSTRLDASAAADAARRLPAGGRSARARHRGGDRARPDGRRLRACATTPKSGDRRPAAGRRRVPGLHLLAGRQPRAAGPHRRGAASCSSGSAGSATTSGCCPRNTTRRPSAWSATFPRRSRTSRWSTAPTIWCSPIIRSSSAPGITKNQQRPRLRHKVDRPIACRLRPDAQQPPGFHFARRVLLWRGEVRGDGSVS